MCETTETWVKWNVNPKVSKPEKFKSQPLELTNHLPGKIVKPKIGFPKFGTQIFQV